MTKTIKILGTGCSKCQSMTSIVQNVIKENNINATVEKVEDIMEIMEYNVMSTPALVVDGIITLKGRVPNKTEVLDILKSNNSLKEDNSKTSCCSKNCNC